MYWHYSICFLFCFFFGMNNNMGCIDTVLHHQHTCLFYRWTITWDVLTLVNLSHLMRFSAMNNNMGCIDTHFLPVFFPDLLTMNNNMGCIDTNNQLPYPLHPLRWTITWDVLTRHQFCESWQNLTGWTITWDVLTP